MRKRGIISDYLIWILLAVAILAILSITIYFLQRGGFSLINKVNNITRLKT